MKNKFKILIIGLVIVQLLNLLPINSQINAYENEQITDTENIDSEELTNPKTERQIDKKIDTLPANEIASDNDELNKVEDKKTDSLEVTSKQSRALQSFSIWFPDQEFAKAVADSTGSAITDVISDSDLAKITTLNIPNRDIQSIEGIEYLSGLTTFDISGSSVTDFSRLTNNTSLRNFTAIKCSLTSIDFLANKDLSMVKVGNLGSLNPNAYAPGPTDNIISDLAVLKNQPNLETLDIEYTKVASLSVAKIGSLPKLKILKSTGNGLSDISGLEGSLNLEQLGLDNNQISDLTPLSGLSKLQQVRLERNEISNIDSLQGAKNSIYDLRLTSNKLNDNSIQILGSFTNLYTLYLNYNQITDVSILSTQTKLNVLNFSDNFVEDVSTLASLTTLTNLSFMHNNIEDISDLSSLTNLKTFQVGFNKISDISCMQGMTQLTSIGIQNNKIYDISALSHLEGRSISEFLGANQEAEPPLEYKIDGKIKGSNVVTYIDSSKIAPTYDPNDGVYDSIIAIFTWTRPVDGEDNDKGSEEYHFNYQTPFGRQDPNTGVGTFSGKVTQPWKAKYSLNFDVNGGTTTNDIERQLLLYDKTGTEPEEPTLIGADFLGWFWDDENTIAHEWDFANDKMPYNDVYLYAQWRGIDYTLSFDVNGGDTTAPDNQTLQYKDKATAVDEPTREGYSFEGWKWTNKSSVEAIWDFDTTEMPAYDVELVAQWKLADYTLSFELKGGTSVNVNDHKSQEKLHIGDKGVEPADPIREGYTFEGWKWTDKANVTRNWVFGTSAMPGHDVTLKAQWRAIDYSLSFDLKSGASVNANDHKTQGQLHIGDKGIKPADPIREGYTFEGWKWTDKTNVTRNWIFGISTMPANNVVLEAQWKFGDYKLSFDLTGGTSVNANDHKTQEQLHIGDKGIKPADPIREGYTFEGWKWTTQNNDIDWIFGTTIMPGHDVTLKSQWKAIDYTLSFNLKGGTSVSANDHKSQDQLHIGDTGVKPANPTREGYTFEGWKWTDQNNVIKDWVFGISTMPASNVVLEAQWKEIGKIPTNPSNPSTPSGLKDTGATESKHYPSITNKAVKTGDLTNINLYGMLLVSFGILGMILIVRKKRI